MQGCTIENVVMACTAPLDEAIPEPLITLPDVRFLMAGKRVEGDLVHHSLSDSHVDVKHDLDTFLLAAPWHEQMLMWDQFRLSNSSQRKAKEIPISSKITR